VSEARAFWVTAPGTGEIRAEAVREPRAAEALVAARASAVSRGTETIVFRGEVPDSEYERMRCPFQEGSFPAPVKYGYASVGIVEQGAAELVGRRVFCLHPHQTRYVVPAASLLPIPPAIPDRRATLAANLETALNGLWDSGAAAGDRIAVIGAGVVGTLAAALAARLPGAAVELIDIDPTRRPVAERLGCRFAAPSEALPDVDIVIHASGRPEGLARALELAGAEATIVELSWYGSQTVPLALGRAFHARRLTLKSSQVGEVPAERRARWSRRRRLALALDLLHDPVFDLLLTGDSEFAALPALMAHLATAPGGVLCHTVSYR
jgi:NADPH:quinone reductase-like Zn-dependent oxidoreductase